MFGGNTVAKKISSSMDTNQPFNCSIELIEQGVDNFRPILEKAGVFGSINNNVVSYKRRRATNHTANHFLRTIIVEDISGKNKAYEIQPHIIINPGDIERLVSRANGSRTKPPNIIKVKLMSAKTTARKTTSKKTTIKAKKTVKK